MRRAAIFVLAVCLLAASGASAAVPDDPAFTQQWGLWNTGQAVDGIAGAPGADIDAPPAWDRTTGSPGEVIAVLDRGVDYAHPVLAANVWTNPGGVGGCPAGTHGFNVLSTTTPCDPMD